MLEQVQTLRAYCSACKEYTMIESFKVPISFDPVNWKESYLPDGWNVYSPDGTAIHHFCPKHDFKMKTEVIIDGKPFV